MLSAPELSVLKDGVRDAVMRILISGPDHRQEILTRTWSETVHALITGRGCGCRTGTTACFEDLNVPERIERFSGSDLSLDAFTKLVEEVERKSTAPEADS